MPQPMQKLKKVYATDLLKQAVALQVAVYEYLDRDIEDEIALNALEEIEKILSFNIRKFVKDNRN